ncbi:hypothetical protein RRG08_007402 [Elysia crispata]|uniref:Uncharacterized protein n=1 Tax=Elysia crispata TaxID=231223 RepID=A0AAE1A3S0_9GAST|nr:hypothetical protein RRG08_007402 [Elysia crispata]
MFTKTKMKSSTGQTHVTLVTFITTVRRLRSDTRYSRHIHNHCTATKTHVTFVTSSDMSRRHKIEVWFNNRGIDPHHPLARSTAEHISQHLHWFTSSTICSSPRILERLLLSDSQEGEIESSNERGNPLSLHKARIVSNNRHLGVTWGSTGRRGPQDHPPTHSLIDHLRLLLTVALTRWVTVRAARQCGKVRHWRHRTRSSPAVFSSVYRTWGPEGFLSRASRCKPGQEMAWSACLPGFRPFNVWEHNGALGREAGGGKRALGRG